MGLLVKIWMQKIAFKLQVLAAHRVLLR